MKIAIACDHGAFELKEALIPFLRSLGHSVRDFGTHSNKSCDYPDYAAAAAQAVADGDCDKGIVLCTTGIGVSITANKIDGIRCALLSDVNSARLTRMHNDTNMMALGAAVVNQSLAFSIVETWLSTPFSNEDRHQRRIDKMMGYEQKQKKKQRNEVRRRRNSSPIIKAISLVLSLLLVFSLSLIPVANFITNLADPSTIVEFLLGSDLLDSLLGGKENPDATEPSDSTEPGGTEGAGSSSGTSEADAGTDTDSAAGETPATSDVDSLLGGMGSLIDSGVIDMDALLGELDLGDADLDMGKLSADIMESDAAKEVLSAYLDDVMNAAMSENPDEYVPTLTGDAMKEIILKPENLDNIITIVENNLSEDAKQDLDTEKLKAAVANAIEAVPVEDLNNAIEAIHPTDAVSTLAQDPTIGPVLKVLKFIRTDALRAVVLLTTLALCILIVLFRLPGMRGLTTIGINSTIAAAGCGVTYLLLSMPMLPNLLGSKLGELGGAILSVLLPVLGELAYAFHTCAIVYAVLGIGLIICTTILRSFFDRIFNAIFSQD